MRRSTLPTLNALTAFESVARHGTVARAAEEMNLSQSAVSRLVGQVENMLEIALFQRVQQRLVLTQAGRSYAASIKRIVRDLEESTLRTMAYGTGADAQVINIGVLATFATKWLMPRLPLFMRDNPGVIISCYTRPVPFDFDADPLDAAIHFGDSIWPGAVAERFMEEELLAVASPAMIDRATVPTAADLLAYPLIHEATRPHAWSDWLAREGAETTRSRLGARFDQFGMLTQAAVAGIGVALLPRFLIHDELARGALVILFDQARRSDQGYCFVYPHWGASNGPLMRLKGWIFEQASLPLEPQTEAGFSKISDRHP